VRERTDDAATLEHPLRIAIARFLFRRRRTVTTRGARVSIKALPYVAEKSDLERRRIPLSLCLAGTAVAMNVLAAVLSLMALSIS
jgi:hypothetical protein